MRVVRWALLVAVTGLVVAACSGVPSSSSPKIVHRVAVEQQDQGITKMPRRGADPREIVSDFLSANPSNDERHSAAGLYLTSDARRKWSPNSVTVLDEIQVSPADPTTHVVTVSGRKLGTVDARGIYQAILSSGGAGTSFSQNVSMQRVAGQWRIAQPPPTLIVDQADFETYFHAVSLYWFDQTESVLVPDLRYSPLDGQSLATWMLDALIEGPRTELSSVISELPEQAEQRHTSVTVGDQVIIEMPGSSELDDATRTRLAAQLATTLEQTTLGPPFTITDAGKRVTIPGVGTQFTSADFTAFAGGPQVSPTLFYLDTDRGDRIADESGQLLTGKVNSDHTDLWSISLTNRGSDANLWVVATAGQDADHQRLLIGTVKQGLRTVRLKTGNFTRPTWAPDKPEAWVAEGGTVYRVSSDDLAVHPVPLGTSGGQQPGNVLALRFSPEGGRIAMVMQTAAGAQLWIGAVVRTGGSGSGTVRVDSLEPISPPGIDLRDVAWNTPTTLYAVGVDRSLGDFGVWQVQVDGALWQQRSRLGLPSAPDTITVTSGRLPWVSAQQALWVQQSNNWQPPGGGRTVFGRSPIYLE